MDVLQEILTEIFTTNKPTPQNHSNIPTPLHNIDLSTPYGLHFFALRKSLLQIHDELTTITVSDLANKQPPSQQKRARKSVYLLELRHGGIYPSVSFVEEYDLTTKEGCVYVGRMVRKRWGYNRYGNIVEELARDCVVLRRRLEHGARAMEELEPPPPYVVESLDG